MKLWFILHGGVKNVNPIELCHFCRFHQYGIDEWVRGISGVMVKVKKDPQESHCKRKNEMRNRLIANGSLTKIEFKDNLYWNDICAEWVKDV
jgi:hypothetical protein